MSARKKKDKPGQLKFTWAVSIVMLVLIFGFFYESFVEIRAFSPVKVAVERVMLRTGGEESDN